MLSPSPVAAHLALSALPSDGNAIEDALFIRASHSNLDRNAKTITEVAGMIQALLRTARPVRPSNRPGPSRSLCLLFWRRTPRSRAGHQCGRSDACLFPDGPG